jgi:hypothetical protein
MKLLILVVLFAFAPLLHAKDNSDKYRVGVYLTAAAVSDGTLTDNFDCGPTTPGSTVCSGGIHDNGVTVYRVQVPDGIWFLETFRQTEDSSFRRTFAEEPVHIKTEKQNPLDLLANGDRVLFRVETHRKLNGTETDISIPFADNPNKEAKFVGIFRPAVVATRPRAAQSDNVQAPGKAP